MPSIPSNRLLVVNQSHAQASDRGPGTEEQPLRTIQAAAELAFPGDTILVHAGVYRETVAPPRGGEPGRPVTYQAAPDEQVAIKGSEIYTGAWKLHAQGLYSADISRLVGEYNPFAAPMVEKIPVYIEQMRAACTHRTLGQVFLDGQPLDEVDRLEHLEAMPGAWLAEENGSRLLLHFPAWVTDPANHVIELTIRKSVFRPDIRGLGYITLRGFTLEHAANPVISFFWDQAYDPQQGLVSCRSGHHWIIEQNTIRYAKSIGLDLGSEGRLGELDGQPAPGLVGYHRVAGNIISDNGQCGICGLGHIGTEIIGNVLERNNTVGALAWEEAAIKTHFYINGRIEGNLIRDNFCHGIWLDNVYQNVRVTRNVILSNRGAGIFIEMGGGPCLIDNNIIGLQAMGNSEIGGNGIYAHDAGGIQAAHNLLIQNAGFGVFMQLQTPRSYAVFPEDIQSFEQAPIVSKPCHCRDQRIQNNIFVENGRGAINLPYPGETAGEMSSDANLFCDWGGAGLFAVNTTAGVEAEEVLAAGRSGAAQGKDSPSSLLPLGKQLMMQLNDWRKVMRMDQHSATAVINNMSWQMLHPGPGPWLTFQVREASQLTCPTLPEVDRDFYGSPLPPQHPAPGPFQSASTDGAFHFRLWPIGFAREA